MSYSELFMFELHFDVVSVNLNVALVLFILIT